MQPALSPFHYFGPIDDFLPTPPSLSPSEHTSNYSDSHDANIDSPILEYSWQDASTSLQTAESDRGKEGSYKILPKDPELSRKRRRQAQNRESQRSFRVRKREELTLIQQTLKQQQSENLRLEREIKALKMEVSNLTQERQCVLGMVMNLCDVTEKVKFFLLTRNVINIETTHEVGNPNRAETIG